MTNRKEETIKSFKVLHYTLLNCSFNSIDRESYMNVQYLNFNYNISFVDRISVGKIKNGENTLNKNNFVLITFRMKKIFVRYDEIVRDITIFTETFHYVDMAKQTYYIHLSLRGRNNYSVR